MTEDQGMLPAEYMRYKKTVNMVQVFPKNIKLLRSAVAKVGALSYEEPSWWA